MDAVQEKLRSGYTTGACAAAATKGALLTLIEQQPLDEVTIRLPGGQVVTFSLHTCAYTDSEGSASVVKDAGDDPDVTHQAEICGRVMWASALGVSFQRGVGVGLVTKKGLPVPPGEPAINPAPRQLITETVLEVLDAKGITGRGVVVEISVPRGEELAKKTFNPRLGIEGGISILGTTGIVVPYSTSAWRATVTQEIDVALAQGLKQLVLTVGARGERIARGIFPMPSESFVQIGPFFGDALRHCAKIGVEKVQLAAMIGKLAKFAAGNESVHSSNSSQDFLLLAKTAQAVGAGSELVEQITQANTAQEIAELIGTQGLTEFYQVICKQAWEFAAGLVGNRLILEVFLTGQKGEILGQFPPRNQEAAPHGPQ